MIKSAESDLRPLVVDMLIKDNKFKGYAEYVATIKFYWSEEIDTACAGYGFIFFNPNFWDTLTEDKQKTIVAHEILHLILEHLDRMGERDQESYNIAGDYIINSTLKHEGFDVRNPFGNIDILIDDKNRFPIWDWNTEQVYDVVHKERKQQPKKHKPSGAPSKSQIEELVQQGLDAEGDEISTVDKQKDRDKKRLERASNFGKQAGSNASMDRTIFQHKNTVKIHDATYEEIFEPYLTEPLSGGHRTFLRPARRQAAGGLRLKGRTPKKGITNKLKHLVYALDVSGSISSHQKQMFFDSAVTIKKLLNPSSMTLMCWDTRITFQETYTDAQEIPKLDIRSGGGTSLGPVYAAVRQIQPEALVIFTDLCVQVPPEPEWETIWFVPQRPDQRYLAGAKYGTVYNVPKK